MAVSKAQQASVNKYVKSNYDRINVTMQKGRREVIQAHAAAQGESVNAFINRAIMEAMERDKAQSAPGGQSISPRPCRPRAGVDSGPGGAYNEHRKGRCDKRLARDVKNPKAKP